MEVIFFPIARTRRGKAMNTDYFIEGNPLKRFEKVRETKKMRDTRRWADRNNVCY